jgi:CheY-like chemotaxis protein
MKTVRHILVVEDNEDDAFFMRRALRTAAPSAVSDFVADGQAALDYLRGSGGFGHRAGQSLPDIVFLDLKLPYVPGLDVLAAIRAAPSLSTLPVIVLTSSGEERDRVAAAKLGIEAYLVKPPTGRIITDVLGQLSFPDSAAPTARSEPTISSSSAVTH